jgi:hypothetical protein
VFKNQKIYFLKISLCLRAAVLNLGYANNSYGVRRILKHTKKAHKRLAIGVLGVRKGGSVLIRGYPSNKRLRTLAIEGFL